MMEEMRTFVLFAEEGSIGRVAQRIPLTQPAVTRQIQRLEQLLGAELLDRRQKPPRLTPAGHDVIERCRTILAAFEEMKEVSNRTEPEGMLRLGLSHGLSDERCAAAIAQALAGFPRVSLRLVTGWSDDLANRFRQGQLDAAIVLRNGLHGDEGEYIGDEQIVVVGSDRKVECRPPGVDGFRSWPWVLSPPPCDARRALTDAIGSPVIAAEIQDAGLQLFWVRRGIGFGLMPRRLIERAKPSGITEIDTPHLDLSLSVVILRSPHLRRLASVIERIGASLRAEQFSVSPDYRRRLGGNV
jgi:DNA-binding transcriptional LysR family regulator